MLRARVRNALSDAGRSHASRERQPTQTQIQYLGFRLKTNGRDYTYRVINPKDGDREFTLTISNRAFSEHHVPYQDAAGTIESYTTNPGFVLTLSDSKIDEAVLKAAAEKAKADALKKVPKRRPRR